MPAHPPSASGNSHEPSKSTGEPREKLGSSFRRLWRGELPLWDAFWTYYVLGQVLAYFIGAFVGPEVSTLFGEERALIVIGLFTLVLPVLYVAFAGVGVWRSASGRGVLGILARGVVIVQLSSWLFVIWGLIYAAIQGRFPND
jgi:hypothetical protein